MHSGDRGERNDRHRHGDWSMRPPPVAPGHGRGSSAAPSDPGHGHDRDQVPAAPPRAEVAEYRVQPGRDRVEHAHADEQQAAKHPHEPVAPQPAQRTRDGRIARDMPRASGSRPAPTAAASDRRGRLDPQQQPQAAGVEQRPADEDGDRGCPRYSDTLPIETAAVRSRPGSNAPATLVIELSTNGWPTAITNWPAMAQPYDDGPARRTSAAGAGQGRAEAERPLEAGVEPAAGRQRQDDVHQREDPGEVTHRPLGHPHDPMGLGRDRRVGEPEELGARGQQRISRPGSPTG